MSFSDFAPSYLQRLDCYQAGLSIEKIASQFGFQAEDMIKLASNENPLGASPLAYEAISSSLSKYYRYPESGSLFLREALAEKLGIEVKNLIIGSGSDELIGLLGKAFLNPEVSVAYSRYAFAMYSIIGKLADARLIEVPALPSLAHNVEAMAEACDETTRILFLANPNNPTGTFLSEKEIDFLADSIPESTLLVIDEAYFEYLDKPNHTLKYLKEGRENICILRTFSKAYGLAGLRVGYAIAPEGLIELLQRIRLVFNVSVPAQVATLAALKDEQHLINSRNLIMEERKCYFDACKKMGLQVCGQEGNFILVKTKKGKEIAQEMLRKGVIIRAMDMYSLPDWIRISFGKPEENIRCLKSLSDVLSS